MADKKILFTGLPLTGKTTFIAALWYMLYNHKNDSKLKLGPLTGTDDEYLNEMSNAWMQYEDVPRTSRYKLAGENVSITTVNVESGSTVVLDIPDFSGETFKDHYDQRVWTEDFYNRIQDTNSIMLFVSPRQRNNRPKLIVMEQDLLRHMGAKVPEKVIDFTEYDPEYTPNQVKIVDELQFFRKFAKWRWPIKIALMISAWDMIQVAPNTTTNPEEWLKYHIPLLYQYLKCNGDLFEIKYYGISAQGGNYKNKDKIADLNPMDRIQLQEGNVYLNDITDPILWLSE
ncbi:hypothetical protein [Mucilaginibacter sp. 44-25]|uniref:TRAFAC clade GTPase domain-containing protein n=1 Tax=Mucilaginibacter sp. 44-25 TaxID=1895794 RepID=UPI00096024B8|nr:hypothetical protein [Mucilaginibacter sp. 44-25]OJW12785.1 MAG: hypothetical protein BGO48_02570 [Mucilaginibacter sp. 44-25]